MAELSCEEIQDRIELLALNALDADDQRALEAHLENCPDCQAAFERALRTVELLPEAAQSLDPVKVPDGVKTRLFERLSVSDREEGIGRLPKDAPTPTWTDRAEELLGRFRWRWAVVAVNVIVLVVLGGLFYQQQTTTEQLASQVERLEAGIDILLDRSSGGRLFLRSTSEANSESWGNVFTHRDSNLAVVLVADTSPPPPGAEYHVWFQQGDELTDAGVVEFTSDFAAADHGWLITRKPEAIDRVLVTLEPKGSPSSQPVGPTILAAAY